jgi:DNA-binding ferritin-like protein
MTNLLGLLRAMQIHYHMLHWQAHGPSFAGDHKMYKTIYKSVTSEIDTWAEKLVYYVGPQSVSDSQVVGSINYWISRWGKLTSEAEIAIVPELDFQTLSRSVIEDLRKSGKLSLGIDDFIMSSCNNHERNLYMLQQRFDLQNI